MKIFVTLVVVAAVVTSVRGQCPTRLTQGQKDTILQAHNAIRQAVANGERTGLNAAKNMIELVWNDKVAAKAQEWANNGNFDHDEPDERKIYDNSNNLVDLGQNLGSTLATSSPNFEKAVNSLYYDEEEDLISANIVQSFNSANLLAYGHASQIIWATTKAIGCGTYPVTFKSQKLCMLVCNYAPPGNYEEKSIYIEGSAASKCSRGQSSAYSALCANPGGLS